MQQDYLERVYAGLLGMNIGIRLGAPVEPAIWTSARIEWFYGDIHGYVKPFKNFAADDDANGPVYFLRALTDKRHPGALTPKDVGDAWLNYSREEIGMFWWGGYGVSTEHTAYLNLKAGIPAPASGSIATNGKVIAEQIGGQIFVDTWGLIHPGDPAGAARDAMVAASVSHDGNGLYGAGFMAGCIAQAFTTCDVREIIDAGLAQIPADCTYTAVTHAVLDYYEEHPDDWRGCLSMLQADWGYDKYPGICHMIPNAGVCVMALVYGQTLARAVEIATMAGWDTDCNAGNIGTVLGVAGGLAAVPDHYRAPVGDGIVLSGISGSLNILDLPTYAREVAAIGYQVRGEEVPEGLAVRPGEVDLDFLLPGSTHNLRLRGSNLCSLRHSRTGQKTGSGCAEILFDRMTRPQSCHIFYKPFYRRADFDDERYMPVFSPTAYPGQQVTITLRAERETGEGIILSPYVRNTHTGEELVIESQIVRDGDWRELTFTIPDLDGAMVDEIGVILESNSPAKNRDFGCLYIDRFTIAGKADYTIAMSKQTKEFASITPFSHNHGAWELEDGRMHAICLSHAEAMTGNYYMTDAEVTGALVPHTGSSHLLSIRVQGALRGYYGGFGKEGLVLCKNDSGMQILASCPFEWAHETEYTMTLRVQGGELTLSVDGQELLHAQDDAWSYGMTGYALYDLGRCSFGDLHVREL